MDPVISALCASLSVPSISTSITTSTWTSLPIDLISCISHFLQVPSLLSLASLSHHYHYANEQHHTWKHTILSLALHEPYHHLLSSIHRNQEPIRHCLLNRLQHIDISHSLFSVSSLSFMTACGHLRSLKIHQSQLDPTMLLRLLNSGATAASLQQLHSIQLSKLLLSDEIITALASLTSLTSINLQSASGFTAESFKSLSSLKHLRILNLDGCTAVDDVAITALISEQHDTLHHLHTLKLSSTTISDITLHLIAQHCPQLTQLALTACANVTTDGLNALSVHLASVLQSLWIDKCPGIMAQTTWAASEALASPLPAFSELRSLSVSGLSHAMLRSVCMQYPYLSRLSISAPHLWTMSTLTTVLNHATNLTQLTLNLHRHQLPQRRGISTHASGKRLHLHPALQRALNMTIVEDPAFVQWSKETLTLNGKKTIHGILRLARSYQMTILSTA